MQNKKPIDFNALSIALKVAINNRDLFTKQEFCNRFKNLLQDTESKRFFEAMLQECYIRNVKGYKYTFIIEAGIASKDRMILFFDKHRIRKAGRYTPTDDQRDAARKRMQNMWKQRKAVSLDSFSDEQLQQELAMRQQKRTDEATLNKLFEVSGMNIQQLQEFLARCS